MTIEEKAYVAIQTVPMFTVSQHSEAGLGVMVERGSIILTTTVRSLYGGAHSHVSPRTFVTCLVGDRILEVSPLQLEVLAREIDFDEV